MSGPTDWILRYIKTTFFTFTSSLSLIFSIIIKPILPRFLCPSALPTNLFSERAVVKILSCIDICFSSSLQKCCSFCIYLKILICVSQSVLPPVDDYVSCFSTEAGSSCSESSAVTSSFTSRSYRTTLVLRFVVTLPSIVSCMFIDSCVFPTFRFPTVRTQSARNYFFSVSLLNQYVTHLYKTSHMSQKT